MIKNVFRKSLVIGIITLLFITGILPITVIDASASEAKWSDSRKGIFLFQTNLVKKYI